MLCPYDKIQLEKNFYEAKIEVDECPECHSIFLDYGELEQIQTTVERDYSGKIGKGKNEDALEYAKSMQISAPAINCPKCGVAMNKEVHGNTKIVIDHCPSCRSLWLDNGELEALEVYAESQLEVQKVGKLGILWSGFGQLFSK